jgi:glucokinase
MYILFDIGGTNTRVAQTDDLHALGEIKKFDTALSYSEGIQNIRNTINELTEGADITAMAGGIRGPLNHEKTGITSEVKLVDWVGRSVVADLQEACDVPVYLENDSALVGLGEAVYGAGRDYEIVAYHTVSTGVGGARYVNGKIDASSVGFEPGHQVIDVDRTVLGLHTPPTLENLVSGTALEKRRGVKPYEIPQDDEVWDELAQYLAAGLKNTTVYWSPDIIVLGGSMILGDPRIFLEPIQKYTKEALGDLMAPPVIADALFRDEGGLYGAMALLAQKGE